MPTIGHLLMCNSIKRSQGTTVFFTAFSAQSSSIVDATGLHPLRPSTVKSVLRSLRGALDQQHHTGSPEISHFTE